MTLEDLGRAVHQARDGAKILFVTKTPHKWLLGFLGLVSNPSNIMYSMRKAEWKGGGFIIVTDQIDEERISNTDRIIINDDACTTEEYVAYLLKEKGAWVCSK